MGLHLVQILYWLALSTWFGGVLFVALSAPVIFRTVREQNPLLPTVLSVNLEGQHGTLLAGSIVGNLLTMLLRVQIICAAVILLALIVQWVNHLMYGQNLLMVILRTGLYVALVVIMLYDWLVASPRIRQFRQEYLDNADNPDIANPAKEKFDQYHRDSVTMLSVQLFMLLGMILFSGNLYYN